MSRAAGDRRAGLPGVDRLLARPEVRELAERWAHRAIVHAARAELERARRRVADGAPPPADEELARAVRARLERLDRPGPRRVVNATGVVVHTNLGRAPLAPAAAEHVARVAACYSDLEFDLGSGRRGSRQAHVAPWLELLFPDHGVLAVNNNAAALLLALNTLALGRGVAISRGELVEIGGSFRVPEILERSGARLVEVGTTNRTHPDDYARVCGRDVALLLKVWPSNYRIVGFTRQVGVRELAPIAADHGLPLVVDQGCGRLYRDAPGPDSEPSVEQLLADGADLVCFSGDKLLGGPQAGILVGRRELVARCARNPLARALRCDKLTLAALSWTCRAWLVPDPGAQGPPVARMLAASPEQLETRAVRLADALLALGNRVRAAVIDGEGRVGGGAAPEQALPTRLVALGVDGLDEQELARRLRGHEPPVVARVEAGRVLLDPRTLLEGEDEIVVSAVRRIVAD
ncbi:MAG: L-seryl-tRNA(Sec) selenium transferase [Acidobacteria bacterium]|nr:MAG: L-seryl-tRNA(Sec) selenium transferase [Acidobacteriota bacterium]